jgi:hypothetical protein
MGWQKFVKLRRKRGDFADVKTLPHPANRLLHFYKQHGVPVRFHQKPWTKCQIQNAISRGPHRSCHEYIDYLQEEFIDMIKKSQWVVLPYRQVQHFPNLRISPPGVIPQRGRRPRWIVDYSWYDVNNDTIPIYPKEAMQFGHALDRILREIILADPTLGPTYLLKLDISDGFYRVNLNIDDIPKLGVAFPTRPGEEPLVALPLVLPMGWTASPPCFSAATETSADLANFDIQHNVQAPPHPLDDLAATMDQTPPRSCPLPTPTIDATSTAAITPSTHTPQPTSAPHQAPSPNPLRDPSLPSRLDQAKYIDVFVDDFIAICQGHHHHRNVRRILLKAIDNVFRPIDFYDDASRREPVSIKKLRQGDVSWDTTKLILGWVIDTTASTIHLPQHRQERLAEILASIPSSQKRISIKKWHKILGELRSMALALPGARSMFSHMQHALSTSQGTRIALRKGVHEALNDFRWMFNDITSRPTRIQELIPLSTSALGFHDSSGSAVGGVWFPHQSLHPRKYPNTIPSHRPIVWRFQWPSDIVNNLVTSTNPSGSISISDLELAGGLLHLDVLAQHFDIRERTVLSNTDNLAALFWQRKGSTTSSSVPAYLLRLFGIHQRFHCYVPRHDYISGLSNPMADDSSRLPDLTDSLFLSHFNSTFPQKQPWRLVRPLSQMLSGVISALRTKMSPRESLLVAPPAPVLIGTPGSATPLSWASTPYSKPSRTKYNTYKSSSDEFEPDNYQQPALQSSLDRLKITYGRLHRRSLQWTKPTQD